MVQDIGQYLVPAGFIAHSDVLTTDTIVRPESSTVRQHRSGGRLSSTVDIIRCQWYCASATACQRGAELPRVLTTQSHPLSAVLCSLRVMGCTV